MKIGYRIKFWWEYSTLRKYVLLIKNVRHTLWRLKRILFEKGELSIVEKAKLKSELGIKWNEIERETMKEVLERTI